MCRRSLTRAKPLNGGIGEAMGGKCKALRRNQRRNRCSSDHGPTLCECERGGGCERECVCVNGVGRVSYNVGLNNHLVGECLSKNVSRTFQKPTTKNLSQKPICIWQKTDEEKPIIALTHLMDSRTTGWKSASEQFWPACWSHIPLKNRKNITKT